MTDTTGLSAAPATTALTISGPQVLALLEDGCRALAAAVRVEDAKQVRDVAQAVAHHAKVRGWGIQAQNDAAELKVRAERRMGELLREMPGHGSHGGDRKSTGTVRVDFLGLTHSDSSRWQRIASLEEPDFERHIAEVRDAGQEITTAGLLRLAKQLRRPDRQPAPESQAGCTVADLAAAADAGRRYGTVYADPPWQYGNQATRASAGGHYRTMPLEEIKALPVARLAAEPAHCHLWTTNGFLREAFDVLAAWGFEYKSCFVWCKPQMGIGNYWRVSHEFLLLGVRGALPFADKGLMSWRQEDRDRHSAKPGAVREMVERASPGPRIELFGRLAVPGWDVWGDQVSKDLFSFNLPEE